MKTERQLKVSIACLRLPLPLFLMCGRSIVKALANNEYYTGIFPPLDVVDEAIEDLAAKAGRAMNGDRLAIVIRDAAWAKAGLLLRQLAGSVQARCQNNLVIPLGSGFVPIKRRSATGQLKAPVDLRSHFTGKSGEAKLLFKPVHGSRGGYLIQLGDSADGPFSDHCSTTSSRVLLTGLEPMKIHWSGCEPTERLARVTGASHCAWSLSRGKQGAGAIHCGSRSSASSKN